MTRWWTSRGCPAGPASRAGSSFARGRSGSAAPAFEGGVPSEGEAAPLRGRTRTLRRGEDFDQVVLGIPVGALPDICGELMERDERFRRGIESAVTVQTQAFQLWSNKTAAELGWDHDENSVAGCYVEPLDTYCDMTHLIGRESWPEAGGARTIGYFCGVIDDQAGETPAETAERAKRDAIEFVERDLGALWPRARRGDRFDWDVLIDPEDRRGPERFDAQYSRVNVAPWERYVLTPAGTVEHRLPSGDSGFENLVLAGDWTANGIDGGCVEAAVISGMDAAKALTGSRQPIPGADTSWLRSAGQDLPAYVEFGGRATAPAPFACEQGRLNGLLLHGDKERIDDLVERMFNGPAGRAMEYRALGSQVLLLDRELRAGHLADPTVRPLGRRDRDPGVVLDPGGRRPRPRRAVRRRAPAAGGAVHLRGQPDVLPRGPRGIRVCQDDGALLPRGRPRRDDRRSRPLAATSVATRGRPGASSSRSRRFPDRARERLRARPPASSAS